MLYRLTIPSIIWSGGTLLFSGPLDGARAYALPDGSAALDEIENGEQEGWVESLEYFLDGLADYIPGETLASGPYAGVTGWDGAAGWDAFLRTAWNGESFTWRPDASAATDARQVVLVRPHVGDFPAPEDDFTRSLSLRLRSIDGSPFIGY